MVRPAFQGALLAVSAWFSASAAACAAAEAEPAPGPAGGSAGATMPGPAAPSKDAGTPEPDARADGKGASPDAAAFRDDKTPFASADALCAWVNQQRRSYEPHDRWRGLPAQGASHQTVTWPIELTIDPAVSALAQTEAVRVANGGAPAGTPVQLNFQKKVWFAGVSTASYRVTSSDVPGDWVPASFTGEMAAGLATNNPAARMGVYYQDPGGHGPALKRMGCGAALAPDGRSRHWVIAFEP